MVNLTVIGISLNDGGGPVLLLHPHGADTILSLQIGPMEAFAISSALHGRMPHPPVQSANIPASGVRLAQSDAESEQALSAMYNLLRAGGVPLTTPNLKDDSIRLLTRPVTHDLMLSTIRALGGKLLGVEITHRQEGVYYAEAVFSAYSGLVRVDCRPSDGVALALRCGALVRAADSVLSHVHNMGTVLAALPPHIRSMAEAALLEEEKAASQPAVRDFSSIPLIPADQAQSQTPAIPQPVVKKMPTIRVSIVQHEQNDSHVIEEFQITPGGVAKAVQSTENSLPHSPSESGNHITLSPEASEDERWSALLQVLSPETKVLM